MKHGIMKHLWAIRCTHFLKKIKKSHMSLVEWSRQMGNSKTKLEEKKIELEALTTMNSAEILL